MAQQYFPFTHIVDEIKRLCRIKASGSLFIATDSNRSAHVMLEDGELIFIYYYNKHGIEALDAMCSIQSARHHFQAGMVSDQRTPLPPTSDILSTLADAAPEETETDATVSVPHKISPEQQTVIEGCLAEYIGPVASFICEDCLKFAVTLDAALDALMAEFPSAGDAQLFRSEVVKKLGI